MLPFKDNDANLLEQTLAWKPSPIIHCNQLKIHWQRPKAGLKMPYYIREQVLHPLILGRTAWTDFYNRIANITSTRQNTGMQVRIKGKNSVFTTSCRLPSHVLGQRQRYEIFGSFLARYRGLKLDRRILQKNFWVDLRHFERANTFWQFRHNPVFWYFQSGFYVWWTNGKSEKAYLTAWRIRMSQSIAFNAERKAKRHQQRKGLGQIWNPHAVTGKESVNRTGLYITPKHFTPGKKKQRKKFVRSQN